MMLRRFSLIEIDPGVLQGILCTHPLHRALFEQHRDEVLAVKAEILEVWAYAEVENATLRPPKHGRNVWPVEGHLGAKDEEEQGTTAEAVDLCPVRLVSKDLRGRVPRGTATAFHLCHVLEVAGNAEIGEHRAAIAGQQHVFWLHITVYNLMAVDVRKRREKTYSNFPGTRLCKEALDSCIKKVTPVTTLHKHNPMRLLFRRAGAIAVEQAMESDNTGMPLDCSKHGDLLTDIFGDDTRTEG
mmetsp:Transcript_59473/g.143556  ORF Transcript_59473/g.143556 Transcript_59473/m.143556 type:complete len:242 (+) Transcript_59473:1515-2240(+)